MSDPAARVPYPATYWIVAVYEATTAALLEAGRESENPRIRDAFGCLSVGQPPPPEDSRAREGATAYQLDAIGRLHGLDAEGFAELFAIARRVGMSARHAHVLWCSAQDRAHEIRQLEELMSYDPNPEKGERHG